MSATDTALAPAGAINRPPVDRGMARPGEKPIFVSESGRRRRALRWVGVAFAVLTAGWLVALVAGAVGLGSLPAIPLPHVGAIGRTSHPSTHPAPVAKSKPGDRSPANAGSALQSSTPHAQRRAQSRLRVEALPGLRTRRGKAKSPSSSAPVTPTSSAPGTSTSPRYTPSGNAKPAQAERGSPARTDPAGDHPSSQGADHGKGLTATAP
jgi:hypothetical protein